MSTPPAPENIADGQGAADPAANVGAPSGLDPRVRLAVQLGGAVLMGVLFLMLGRRPAADDQGEQGATDDQSTGAAE